MLGKPNQGLLLVDVSLEEALDPKYRVGSEAGLILVFGVVFLDGLHET